MEAAERAKLEEEIRTKQEEVSRIQEEVEIKDTETRRLQEEVEDARRKQVSVTRQAALILCQICPSNVQCILPRNSYSDCIKHK